MPIGKTDLEQIALAALQAFPASTKATTDELQLAEDMACRLLWKEVAKRKKQIGKLSPTEIQALQDRLMQIVRQYSLDGLPAVPTEQETLLEDTVEAGTSAKFDEAGKRELADVIAHIFETTFDGSEDRRRYVADRARSEVDVWIERSGIRGADLDAAREWAQQCIKLELASV